MLYCYIIVSFGVAFFSPKNCFLNIIRYYCLSNILQSLLLTPQKDLTNQPTKKTPTTKPSRQLWMHIYVQRVPHGVYAIKGFTEVYIVSFIRLNRQSTANDRSH